MLKYRIIALYMCGRCANIGFPFSVSSHTDTTDFLVLRIYVMIQILSYISQTPHTQSYSRDSSVWISENPPAFSSTLNSPKAGVRLKHARGIFTSVADICLREHSSSNTHIQQQTK